MSLKDKTKEAFAEALQHLLRTKSFEKIQVKDLCEFVGASRPTFYYHFKDKYDLSAWIFTKDYEAIFSTEGADFSIQNSARLLQRFYEKKELYKKMFSDHSQNSISKYIQDFDVAFGIKVMKYAYQTDEVSEDQLYMIRHYSYGSIHMLIDWLLERYQMTPEHLAELQHRTMPDFLLKAYINYHK